jgi:hypothetical protein
VYLSVLHEEKSKGMTVITLDEKTITRPSPLHCQRVAEKGGNDFDATGRCALKANAPTIYTWDLDFFAFSGRKLLESSNPILFLQLRLPQTQRICNHRD